MPVRVDHLAGLPAVENAPLGHGEADAHDDAAVDLVVVGQAAHHAPAVVGAEEAQDLDLAGALVDLHLAELRRERAGRLALGIRSAVPDADDYLGAAELLDLTHGQRFLRVVDRNDLAVFQGEP